MPLRRSKPLNIGRVTTIDRALLMFWDSRARWLFALLTLALLRDAAAPVALEGIPALLVQPNAPPPLCRRLEAAPDADAALSFLANEAGTGTGVSSPPASLLPSLTAAVRAALS